MKNLNNFFKSHKKAIIIPTIILVCIAIIILFTNVTFSHFKKLEENNVLLAQGAIELSRKYCYFVR